MKLYKMNKVNLFCIFMLILLFVYFLFIIYDNSRIYSDWKFLYIPMLLTTIISFLTFKTNKKIQSLNSNFVVLIYMVLSLLSLLLLLPIFPELENIRSEYSMSFLYYPELIPSICISCIGIISFTIFSSVLSNLNDNSVKNNIQLFGNGISDIENRKEKIADGIAKFSMIMMIISLIFFAYFSLKHINFFSGSYGERMSYTNTNKLYSYFVIIMGLSFVMFISTTKKEKMLQGLVLFGMISILQFLMGNRGEVFYPALAGIAVYRKRGGTFKKKILYSAIIFCLILIPMIRIVRNIGVLSFDFKSLIQNFNIFSIMAESFGEMGFQIGTIAYMLRYLNGSGMLQYGATYIYSFHYFLVNKIPFLPPIDLNSPAAIKTIMPVNFFAFTNIGEAYFNFKIIGVIIFCFILALFLCKTAKQSKSLFLELFNNLMLVEMIAWVRNSSGTFPVYLMWSFILIILAFLYSNMIKNKKVINEV